MGLSIKPTEVRAMAPAMRLPDGDRRTRVDVREGEADMEEEDEAVVRVREGVAKYGI